MSAHYLTGRDCRRRGDWPRGAVPKMAWSQQKIADFQRGWDDEDRAIKARELVPVYIPDAADLED